MNGRGRICLHHTHLYPAFSDGAIPFAGGAEMQQAMIARGLAARGFEVTAVTCDFGQPPQIERDGVTLLRTYPPDGGVPVLRFFHPRLTRTVAALRRAAADVYFVTCGGLEAGITYDFARRRGASFVFAAASDGDTMRSLPFIRNPRDRWWYRRALQGADARIAQTEAQRQRFQSQFGLDSTVVPNVVWIPDRPVEAGQDGAVLWYGTYKPMKRPEWFVELARSLPARRFIMCGVVPPQSPAAWEVARAASRELGNLDVRGFLPHARISELFGEAAMLVHTSPMEGFPNTVLEAWAHGLPTVTAVDPDGVVRRERLGEVAESPEALRRAVETLASDPAARRAAGARARAYARARHDPGAVFDRLAQIFDRAIEGARARRASRHARSATG